MTLTKIFGSSAVLLVVAGCASAVAPDAPADLAEGSLDEQQLIYSTNTAGTWSADAKTPGLDIHNRVYASAVFTGPTGSTRKMGVCTLRLTETTCSTVADCSTVYVPTGGAKYCTAPNGTGQKVCAVRAGSQTSYCAGSPALGGTAVAPGTYSTPHQPAESLTSYISYACFEGCAATDPSSSSAVYNTWNCSASPQFCFRYYPGDDTCGGNCPDGI